jgi:N-acyl-D-aspartate/D-glutamate deacylase
LLGYWVSEQQAMPLEEAVYRLTGKTALMHDITDRCFIAAGKVADITIFDPDTIAPKPREPAATLPAGGVQVKREAVVIDHVIVNGRVLFEKGELTGALPGQIVRGRLYRACRRKLLLRRALASAHPYPFPARRSGEGGVSEALIAGFRGPQKFHCSSIVRAS